MTWLQNLKLAWKVTHAIMQEKEKEEFQEVILEDESTKCIEVSYRISALINSKQVSEVASFSIKITGWVNKGLFHRCFKGISSEFSEKLFLRTPLNRCFCLQYICFSLKTILAVAERNCKWPWTSLSNYGN